MREIHLANTIDLENYKSRFGPDGIHLFNKNTGTNILLEEIPIPEKLWSKAPRQVSIALTNLCDLSCSHCYAPKHTATLDFDLLKNWLLELDKNDCLSVGLGGGEPTLYPKFLDLCEFVSNETDLALTMTTHGHRLTSKILDSISSNVNFIRVSMDGVNSTYEEIRGRSFQELVKKIELLSSFVSFGINFVVNSKTVKDLTEAIHLAERLSASEFLLLPEVPVGRGSNIDSDAKRIMKEWINSYKGKMKLSISENHVDGIPIFDPFVKEVGLSAYAHIDAEGFLKTSSFDENGVLITGNNVIRAFKILKGQKEEVS